MSRITVPGAGHTSRAAPICDDSLVHRIEHAIREVLFEFLDIGDLPTVPAPAPPRHHHAPQPFFMRNKGYCDPYSGSR